MVRCEITRLGSLAGQQWVFVVTCPRCRETRERRLDSMIERNGPDRLESVARRFRCSTPRPPSPSLGALLTCGVPPSEVVLRNRLFTVVLVGPGAIA